MRLRFGEFEFNNQTGELSRGKTSIHLQPQPARVLALLTAQPGELVTREALQQHVWDRGTVVDFEQGLNWCIGRLREVLQDTPSEPKFIQTVPRRGYRFVANVQELAPAKQRSVVVLWWKSRSVGFVACSILSAGMVVGIAISQRQQNVTVLVLPFDDLSIKTDGLAYADVAFAELTSGLARRDPTRLSVIDPLTARKFKNTKECIIKIGNQLGADYVLLGGVEQSTDAIKVDAQLFRVSTNRQVWATEKVIPRDASFSMAWAGMANSIASTLQIRDALKE
jgi:DNA-binding winged helix-turn-helix (wHTH) protein/TolB-like protein